MRGVLIAPLVKRYGNEVLCDLVEVGLQGQIHIGLASTIPEEAEKVTEWNATLNDMDRNIMKKTLRSLGRCLLGRANRKGFLLHEVSLTFGTVCHLWHNIYRNTKYTRYCHNGSGSQATTQYLRGYSILFPRSLITLISKYYPSKSYLPIY